jgi:hypothetical protein
MTERVAGRNKKIGGSGRRTAGTNKMVMMSDVERVGLDRSAFEITTLEDESTDRRFWLAKSPPNGWRR